MLKTKLDAGSAEVFSSTHREESVGFGAGLDQEDKKEGAVDDDPSVATPGGDLSVSPPAVFIIKPETRVSDAPIRLSQPGGCRTSFPAKTTMPLCLDELNQ